MSKQLKAALNYEGGGPMSQHTHLGIFQTRGMFRSFDHLFDMQVQETLFPHRIPDPFTPAGSTSAYPKTGIYYSVVQCDDGRVFLTTFSGFNQVVAERAQVHGQWLAVPFAVLPSGESNIRLMEQWNWWYTDLFVDESLLQTSKEALAIVRAKVQNALDTLEYMLHHARLVEGKWHIPPEFSEKGGAQ